MRSQAHRIDARSVDEFMRDELRKPKYWALGLLLTVVLIVAFRILIVAAS
jgi:hypothetical protein